MPSKSASVEQAVAGEPDQVVSESETISQGLGIEQTTEASAITEPNGSQAPSSDPSLPPKVTLRGLRAQTEMNAISRALQQTGWNRRRAAELLSISYRGLLYKIRQHNLTPPTDSQLSPFTER